MVVDKKFMNDVWSAQTIAGEPVIARRVKWGTNPDIEFTIEKSDGEIDIVSAFDMFETKMEWSS